MPIPEAQLQTWSNLGATATATQTYTSIKAALDQVQWPVGHAPDIYLQGSYRNSTNIYSESDVDVVVEIGNTFQSDLAALSAPEVEAYRRTFPNTDYDWADGYADTLGALRAYYGTQAVKPGNKAIAVTTAYRQADVVVAIGHRKYSRFIGMGQETYVVGIQIWDNGANRWITNFPKQHYDNGVAKQARTSNWYKPMVRVMKNANNYMVQNGIIADGTAPSYAMECLVFSVPDDQFGTSYQQSFANIVNWAYVNASAIRRVSEQGALIGTAPGQWQFDSVAAYVGGLAAIWNNWT
jgi:hypothetical protein